ncbi:MAG: POTRA domain-containing protein [bacterium]
MFGKSLEITEKALLLLVIFMIFGISVARGEAEDGSLAEDEEVTFQIKKFIIEGNTVLDDKEVEQEVSFYKGKGKTEKDVMEARAALERFFHRKGYPTVLVNIPEQTIKDGVVRFQVIESRVGKVTITGNRFVTKKKIMRQLSSFQSGTVLYLPSVKEQLGRISSNPDLQVKPVLIPGRELDIINVELQVKDRLPIHGNLEVNNRSTHSTPDLRAICALRYDNLWQMDHTIAAQYQTSPEDRSEVQSLYFSYSLSPPWEFEHTMSLYYIKSDSETATEGGEIHILGKGSIAGFRYFIPFYTSDYWQHTICLGIDYKDFKENIGLKNGEGEDTDTPPVPIQYVPLFLSYSTTFPDSYGSTNVSTSFNMAFRGLSTEKEEFKKKRYRARGNYFFLTARVERSFPLPEGAGLLFKLDGQLANQPLISNEQYPAGGIDNLRGYKESEELGDNAVHLTTEIQSPNLFRLIGFFRSDNLKVHAFYDAAFLQVLDKLSEDSRETTVESKNMGITLQGVGIGLAGTFGKHFQYGFDWGVALNETDMTSKGEAQSYFYLTYQF